MRLRLTEERAKDPLQLDEFLARLGNSGGFRLQSRVRSERNIPAGSVSREVAKPTTDVSDSAFNYTGPVLIANFCGHSPTKKDRVEAIRSLHAQVGRHSSIRTLDRSIAVRYDFWPEGMIPHIVRVHISDYEPNQSVLTTVHNPAAGAFQRRDFEHGDPAAESTLNFNLGLVAYYTQMAPEGTRVSRIPVFGASVDGHEPEDEFALKDVDYDPGTYGELHSLDAPKIPRPQTFIANGIHSHVRMARGEDEVLFHDHWDIITARVEQQEARLDPYRGEQIYLVAEETDANELEAEQVDADEPNVVAMPGVCSRLFRVYIETDFGNESQPVREPYTDAALAECIAMLTGQDPSDYSGTEQRRVDLNRSLWQAFAMIDPERSYWKIRFEDGLPSLWTP